jgi:hypothetical protein
MASPFDEPMRPGVIRIRLGLLLLGLCVLVVAVAGSYWYLRHGGFSPVKTWIDKDLAPWPSWMPSGKQQVSYPLEKKPEVNHVSAPARDIHAEAIAEIRRELREQRQLLEALKNRPAPTAAPAPAAKPAPAKLKVPPPDSLVLYAYTPPKEADPGTGLTAGTVVNCTLKTRVNSERQRVAVAEVREHIRDSRNPNLILMPQYSKLIFAMDKNDLIYGEERVEVWLDRIELPNRQTIELPKEPVVDQIGQGGLTGEIDHKWRYIIPAWFVRGVLAASVQQVTTLGLPLATGLAQEGRTVGQRQTDPYINARPTITIPEGERCAVILTKDVSLPVYHF